MSDSRVYVMARSLGDFNLWRREKGLSTQQAVYLGTMDGLAGRTIRRRDVVFVDGAGLHPRFGEIVDYLEARYVD